METGRQVLNLKAAALQGGEGMLEAGLHSLLFVFAEPGIQKFRGLFLGDAFADRQVPAQALAKPGPVEPVEAIAGKGP